MTKLLEKAVAAVSTLPDEQQDEAAFILLQFAGIEPPLELTAEDEAELAASLAEEARGEFATDEEIREIWAKHGR
jgi:predicted transcriptional regulator